jgi:hypothetical protein
MARASATRTDRARANSSTVAATLIPVPGGLTHAPLLTVRTQSPSRSGVDSGQGELAAYLGDGSGNPWTTWGAGIAYGSGSTLADVDGDGQAEIFAVKMYEDNNEARVPPPLCAE